MPAVRDSLALCSAPTLKPTVDLRLQASGLRPPTSFIQVQHGYIPAWLESASEACSLLAVVMQLVLRAALLTRLRCENSPSFILRPLLLSTSVPYILHIPSQDACLHLQLCTLPSACLRPRHRRVFRRSQCDDGSRVGSHEAWWSRASIGSHRQVLFDSK